MTDKEEFEYYYFGGLTKSEKIYCTLHNTNIVKEYNEDLTECTVECGCKFHWNDINCIWEQI